MNAFLSSDLRFLEVKGEFTDLRTLFDLIKAQLPVVIENHEKEIRKDIEEFGEEGSVQSDYQNMMETFHEEYKSIYIPRYYYNPMIQILYAICEASIRDIAEYCRNKFKCKLKLDELSGGFEKRSDRYFLKVLGMGFLFKKADHSQRFKVVYSLRNAIAHANGRLEMLISDNKKAVQKYAKSEDGVEIKEGCLIISEKFVDESIRLMEEAILDLIKRIPKA